MSDEDTRRRTKGRFGRKTNKTVKYNSGEVWIHKRQTEALVVLENGEIPGRYETPLGISLNARKNWEILENNNRNSLHSSQDDVNVDYGPRILVVEDNPTLNKACRKAKYHHDFQSVKSDGKSHSDDENESKIVNGTNRKGFFAKEKRKKGKKGVHKTHERNRAHLSHESESTSDSDSAIDQEEQECQMIVASVMPKQPDFVRRPPRPGCECSICTGRAKNHKVNQRRQVVKDISDL